MILVSEDETDRLNLQLFAYSQSMNSPFAPLSTRELTDFLSEVSVVSSSTFNFKELDSPTAEI